MSERRAGARRPGTRTAAAAGRRVRAFAHDVRAGMAQREDELNQALGLTPDSETARPRTLPVTPLTRTTLTTRKEDH